MLRGGFRLTATVVSGPVALADKGEGFMLPPGKAAKWRVRIDLRMHLLGTLNMDLGP